MANVRFNVSKEDAAIIEKIGDRAIKSALEAGWMYDPVGARMDITACHRNGNPLRLAELLAAEDFNFSHDVFGIRRNLDRETGKLLNHFSPRFAKPKEHRASRAPVIECKGCGSISGVDRTTGICIDCLIWGEAMLADVAQRGQR